MQVLRSAVLLVAFVSSGCASHITPESIEENLRKRSKHRIDRIYSDLKKSYYDPNFGGKDMEGFYNKALLEIERSGSIQERVTILSNFLLALEDSHTFYAGGNAISLRDFGFSFRFHGESAFVSAVDSWADVSAQQLRPGDEIVSFNDQRLTRLNAHRVVVNFLGLHPIRPLELVVRTPSDSVRNVLIHSDTAAIRKLSGAEYRKLYAAVMDSARRATGHVTVSVEDRVFIWKLPQFEEADISLGKVARNAGKHETVILDMRGNPGGPVVRLEEVLGFFIEQPLEIGTLRTRWAREPFKSKPKRDRLKNRIIVLVDSETASAAEVFTRLLQLEKRATVIGDRTSGAVMASMRFGEASITVSDFVLPNGERLEKVGVQPDIVVIPTPLQLANGWDPVLAYALTAAGVPTTPAHAATLLKPKK